ncbi:hypothetical protein LAZ67_15002077 [Cordylochernes scorpioides]|uniref:Uncharacterized protein n=1 Tax=Cordylochernes scorpioides TaxID=51811 RepID=A0ABY6LBY3_9ARAC|nr:hypothetical protein LAZ67_15002077 [Cordylochernes scorpioides]
MSKSNSTSLQRNIRAFKSFYFINIPNPDDEESETDDHIEERNWSTDTEQYTLSEEENNEDPSFNYYIGKDQKTK